MPVQAEIISIGDELLIGQVINTNAAFLSKALMDVGVSVKRVTTVGDDPGAIHSAFALAWSECEVVLVTGGLGPTHDDVSKSAVATFFGVDLYQDDEILIAVRERFQRFGYSKMPESNVSQAMVPHGFVALPNAVGTAPGLYRNEQNKVFCILPGVPHEMEWIVEHHIKSRLRADLDPAKLQVIKHRTLITSGIGESLLAEKIGDVNDLLQGEATLAFLPRSSGVRLRITAQGKRSEEVEATLNRIEAELKQRVGLYILSGTDADLATVVVELLREAKHSISTAESCTGGMIAAALTDVPSSSEVFPGSIIAYANSAKEALLHVDAATLSTHGAVSEQAAKEMAEGALRQYRTTYALSVTGIAGPSGGTDQKPVGLVFIGLAQAGQPTLVKRFHFQETRKINRERSVAAALELLRKRLTGLS